MWTYTLSHSFKYIHLQTNVTWTLRFWGSDVKKKLPKSQANAFYTMTLSLRSKKKQRDNVVFGKPMGRSLMIFTATNPLKVCVCVSCSERECVWGSYLAFRHRQRVCVRVLLYVCVSCSETERVCVCLALHSDRERECVCVLCACLAQRERECVCLALHSDRERVYVRVSCFVCMQSKTHTHTHSLSEQDTHTLSLNDIV